jgi:formylglycine-generating enzyme required for sulfatase activity
MDMNLSRITTIVQSFGLSILFMLAPLAVLAADKGDAEFAKGWDLLKLKKYQEARAELETGMRKNPSNALAHFYLADACRGLKDWSCAEEHYETSLELDAKSSVAELAKQRGRKAKVWRLLGEAKATIAESKASPEKVQAAKDQLEIANKLGLDDEQEAVHQQLQEKLQMDSKKVAEPADKDLDSLSSLIKGSGRMVRLHKNGNVEGAYSVRQVFLEMGSDSLKFRYVPTEQCSHCWHQSVSIPLRDIDSIKILPPEDDIQFYQLRFSCSESSSCITTEEASGLDWSGGTLIKLSEYRSILFPSPSHARSAGEMAERLCQRIGGCKNKEHSEDKSKNHSEEMPVVLVPEGEFTMGDNQGGHDEKPAHRVYLDAFYVDKYEVTVELYAKFLEATNLKPRPEWAMINKHQHRKRPVVFLDWNDAETYCRWAGKRLPTEAEWEKAARGTDGRIYPWGNDPPTRLHANYGKENWNDHAAVNPVGILKDGKSPYGIYDMAGNVWEWTSDWYDENYYKNSPSKNPKGAASGKYKVLRGGSWTNDPQNLRSTDRLIGEPSHRDVYGGFRCAKTP